MTCGIYQIRNKINNKRYVGSSNNIEFRWRKHISFLTRNKHPNKHLQGAWNKYGKDSFEFTVLLICVEDELLDQEQTCLDVKSEYNISKLAGKVEMTNELKAKLSDIAKRNACWIGRECSEETRRKMSKSRKGHICTEETRKKISMAQIGITKPGHIRTEETRKKISESRKRLWQIRHCV